MKRFFASIGLCVLVLSLWAMGSSTASAALPEVFERTEIVSGLNQPTAFRHLPDGRILITEKSGAVKVYDPEGGLQSQPLITLVVLQTDNDEERGLLGLEPDPDFATNGYLYVSYTTAENRDRLSRITVTGETADPASEVVLIESDQPGNIYHHGGEVRFGPDGKLYWAMGMNTYNPNSQNLSNVHGKILRLNPDGSAPLDNPFVSTPGAIEQIWAYGLRNPFRFNFMPNGNLLTGDVGGDAWEELNLVTRGGNYGWPDVEGFCSGCPYLNPIYAYPHTPPPAKAGSITAVMAYDSSVFPEEYRNKVFIADYTLGFIKYLELDSQFGTFISEHMFDDEAGTVVQLDQGPDGNLYQMNIYPGALYKIALSDGNKSPKAVASSDVIAGLAPLAVNFSSAGSGDPEGVPLTYDWNFGDGSTSTEANPAKTYTTNGTYAVTLTVSDGEKTAQTSLPITVGNRLPTATITSPVDASNYNAGDMITLTGTGDDPEDGALSDASLSWVIDFHHADHKHPFRSGITGSGSTVTLPTSSDNASTTWYRIHLTATDSGGLSSTSVVNIYPNLVTVTYTANFPDATFTIDGRPHVGQFSEQAVVGVQHIVDAPSPQYASDGSQYRFASWSDGGAKSHAYTVPAADGALSVTYDKQSAVPIPWQSTDIGSPSTQGYSSYDDGVFTVNGAGGDIWGLTDEFHYVYQPLSGDGEIIARVTSQENTDDWAKSGIMIKESAAEGADYALLGVTPANGVTFQYNFNGDAGSVPYTFPNAWLKLTRQGDAITAYTSGDGVDWTIMGTVSIAMNPDVTIGLVVLSHKYDQLNQTVFDNVSVVSENSWANTDVGSPTLTGSASMQNDTMTITGAGDDIWGAADQFHYAYQTLTGDGQIVARVTSQTGATDEWAKAGVMIKASTTAGSNYALLGVTPSNGLAFQYNFNGSVSGIPYAFPDAWLKLQRVGNVITAYSSEDGVAWTQVGSATVAMPSEATVGLFVTSHDGSATNTATFDNISVQTSATPPASSLPTPWGASDVGDPTLAGSSHFTNGVFTLNGAGNDIWADADQHHFVHQALSGDGEIVARLTSQVNTNDWAKAGVMIKESTTAGSNYALLAVTPANGIAFQHGYNQNVSGAPYAFPHAWLKLVRVRDIVTAYSSADGVGWIEVGSMTLIATTDIRMGLFVTSHNGGELSTATFDNVSTLDY